MLRQAEQTDTGMELRDLLNDAEFRNRRKNREPSRRETNAFRRLARVFVSSPQAILKELVDVAVEYCGADSAGISLEERSETGDDRFRWIAISGSFSHFLYGTTPRFFSPCGTCLNRGTAQLYRVTKPYYDLLGIEAREIKDGILIPWTAGEMRGTLWAVAHESHTAFDFEDYHLLDGLADFASIAVRHQAHERKLRHQVRETTSVAVVNELAHKINNPLQSVTNAIYLANQGGESAEIFTLQASLEIARLSDLIKELLSATSAARMVR